MSIQKILHLLLFFLTLCLLLASFAFLNVSANTSCYLINDDQPKQACTYHFKFGQGELHFEVTRYTENLTKFVSYRRDFTFCYLSLGLSLVFLLFFGTTNNLESRGLVRLNYLMGRICSLLLLFSGFLFVCNFLNSELELDERDNQKQETEFTRFMFIVCLIMTFIASISVSLFSSYAAKMNMKRIKRVFAEVQILA